VAGSTEAAPTARPVPPRPPGVSGFGWRGCHLPPAANHQRGAASPGSLRPDDGAAEAAPPNGPDPSHLHRGGGASGRPGCSVFVSPGSRAPGAFAPTRRRARDFLELGCPSEHQRRGTGSVWPSPTRLQPHPPDPEGPGGRLVASSRRRLGRGRKRTRHDRLSWTFPLPRSLRYGAAPLDHRPEDRSPRQAPLMSFAAPSAHQAREIHLRGIPPPLGSAFAVGPTLTVCSPPDPAGLFHPAALLGFQGWRLTIRHPRGGGGPLAIGPNAATCAAERCDRRAEASRRTPARRRLASVARPEDPAADRAAPTGVPARPEERTGSLHASRSSTLLRTDRGRRDFLEGY
jgi:hypothetical protein